MRQKAGSFTGQGAPLCHGNTHRARRVFHGVDVDKRAARIKANLELWDFELTPDEVQAVSGLNLDSRLRYDPDRSDLSRL